MSLQGTSTLATPAQPLAGPSSTANSVERDERRDADRASPKWWGTTVVLNEGSTTRDYLARERNFLSWVKLCGFLAIISASLLIRFQFGNNDAEERPKWQINAEIPLGVLFFCAAVGSLFIGTTSFYTSATAYSKNQAFVYAGLLADVVMWGVGLLTITACVVLLAAGDP
ncbi:hypothetical protein JCM11251_001225 [Rhodosporidiobolus azoricus]